MSLASNDKKSPNVVKSFQYAYEGLMHCFIHERNMRIHVTMAFFALILGFLLKVSYIEWIILLIVIGLVLTFELLNTAIEALVDLVTDEYKAFAKIAKDTAAAGVMIFAIISALVGLNIFLPRILEWLK